MSTDVIPSPASRAWSVPRSVRSVSDATPRRAISRAAMQRVALPQAPAVEPSAFQNRSSTSAAA